MIEEYIVYYNNKRLQRKLGVVTPMEKYTNYKVLVEAVYNAIKD